MRGLVSVAVCNFIPCDASVAGQPAEFDGDPAQRQRLNCTADTDRESLRVTGIPSLQKLKGGLAIREDCKRQLRGRRGDLTQQ